MTKLHSCTVLATLLLATAVADAASPSLPAGRLPPGVTPLAYRLDLTILPEEAGFSGTTEIDVQVAAPTPVIWLHGNDLTVQTATWRAAAGAQLPAHYTQEDPTGVAKLAFDAPVPAGRGTLRFTYTAPFRKSAEGLYHSTVAGEAYAFTQFESIDARRMFPGFDEPLFKTPFDITVTTHSANAVIGNAPVLREEPAGDGRKRVVFATTRPLPTYLLALAVGPLDVVAGLPLPPNAVRAEPLPLRAVATRGKGGDLRFALDNTDPIVSYLENYFGVRYPYPKLDLIASPEFGTGAMENAGAIIYGDARLLIPENSALEQRRLFGAIHAHELAHQWFGDLVTPKWWNDAWLNESFATWMGFKASHAWRPAYHLGRATLLQALAVMEADSRIAARQIRQPVETNTQIASSFDGITYSKGAAVLAMFEGYLGEDKFRAGIRTHLKRFAWSVADADDFLASLASGSGRPDVVPAFRTFIDQPGLPLVSVTAKCGKDGKGGAALRISQTRYLPVGSRGNAQQRWQVPVCLRYGNGGSDGRQCVLLKNASATVRLPGKTCPTWVMPNADGAGYYRFALDEAGWRQLIDNFPRLNEREALAAADSLSATFQANRLSTTALLAALKTIAQSPYPTVALAPERDLVRLRDELAPGTAREAVLAFMRATWRPRLAALGATGTAQDDAAAVDEALFRTNLTRFLALEARDPELRRTLAEQARRYIRLGGTGTGLDESAVEPDRTQVALQVGVQELGAPFVEALISQVADSTNSRFRGQAALALGSTDDAEVGNRVRQLLLDGRLRGRETTSLASALAGRPSQRRATFDWFKANQRAYIDHLSHFAHRWLPNLAAGFCTLREHDEAQAVFQPLVGELQGADRTLAEALEGIELCAALAEAKRGEVGRYFAGGASEPSE